MNDQTSMSQELFDQAVHDANLKGFVRGCRVTIESLRNVADSLEKACQEIEEQESLGKEETKQ